MKLIYSIRCSKPRLVIYKNTATGAVNLLVDPDDFFWNPFFEVILDWAPILKQIYETDDNKLDDS